MSKNLMCKQNNHHGVLTAKTENDKIHCGSQITAL